MEPGARHGRYEIVRLLGEGGMGRVYEALLHGPGGFRKRVALKVLKQGGAGLAREARLGGLLRHRNLVEVYALEQVGDSWVCAMELIEGGAITSYLPLEPSAVLDAARQVCAGLAHAQREIGLVHLDLKPDNLLVDRGMVKVADLGVARARGQGAHPLLMGTPAYMAPEQARGEPVDSRADVFSMGVVLIALATGSHGRSPGQVPWLQPVLERCLAADPAERFRGMGELGEALGAVEQTGPSLAQALGQRAVGGVSVGAVGGPTVQAETFRLEPEDLPATNLGSEPDAFVGRREELAELLGRLEQPGVVTVKGLGGLGKTRLARRALQAWHAATGGAAIFCDLGSARQSTGMVEVVATALELPLTEVGHPGQVDQVGHALRTRGPMVLGLDSFEQVLEAAAVVERWAELAPEARWLVTSREPLGLPGEVVVALGPLVLAEATELLRVRAEAVGARISDDPALTELAERLDGIPLALELAAARLGMMSPADMLTRLDQRFRLLRGTRRDLPKRQATLRGALDWSWELLGPAERAVLAQLSVFEGGCTLEAAEAVCDLPDGGWVLDAIEALERRSWVAFRSGRLQLYETVKAYGAEILQDRGGAEQRHGQCMARLGEPDFLERLHGPEGDAGWSELQLERANLVAALERAVARGDGAVAEGCAAAVWEVFGRVGPLGHGLRLLQSVAELEGLDVRGGARMHAMLGVACKMADRPEEALAHLERARGIYAPDGAWPDRRREGRMLLVMASMHDHSGRLEEAGENARQALAIARETGDRRAEAAAHLALSAVHRFAGRLDDALKSGRTALKGQRALGDRRSEVRTLTNLAHIFDSLGRFVESRAHLEAGLELARQLGDRRMEGLILGHLGTQADARGEPSLSLHRAGLRLAREVGSRRSEGIALSNLGLALALGGNSEEAVASLQLAAGALGDAGATRWVGFALGNLGHVLIDAGRGAEAEAPLQEATQIAQTLADAFGEGCWRAGLGALYSERGEHESASEELARAVTLLEQGGNRYQLAKTAVLQARAALARGHRPDALEALGRVQAFLEEVGTGFDAVLDAAFESLVAELADR